MNCSYPSDPWGVIYNDPMAPFVIAVVICDTAPTATFTLISDERRYFVVSDIKPEPPPQKQHGPQRKGRGGKIKRW